MRRTFFIDTIRLGTLDALRVDASEGGRVDGETSVAFAFHEERFVFADDLASKLERPALVGNLDEFCLIGADVRFDGLHRCGKLAVAFVGASFHHGLQQGVLDKEKNVRERKREREREREAGAER